MNVRHHHLYDLVRYYDITGDELLAGGYETYGEVTDYYLYRRVRVTTHKG